MHETQKPESCTMNCTCTPAAKRMQHTNTRLAGRRQHPTHNVLVPGLAPHGTTQGAQPSSLPHGALPPNLLASGSLTKHETPHAPRDVQRLDHTTYTLAAQHRRPIYFSTTGAPTPPEWAHAVGGVAAAATQLQVPKSPKAAGSRTAPAWH